MRHKTFALACVLALGCFTGCETETIRTVKLRGPFDANEESDSPRVTRESKLLERVQKDPKDAQGWFELGEYYERSMQPVDAVNAYEKGNALLEPNRYTGGYYLLAKMYLRLQEWERSIGNLNVIFMLEPKDPKSACLNAHFREAHYLRGAIYHIHGQYRAAKKEFLRFIEIGGEEWRVEESLSEIQAQGE
jgi:tetratricopeptide (TPR) repeat protein